MLATVRVESNEPGVLASLLSDEAFHPVEPQSLDQLGISPIVIETLVCKYLLQIGSTSGRDVARLIRTSRAS